MGVSASEATNIINTLAASSQQGSADVAYLNKAFEKAGTAAKGAGMDYVQLSAAVETIAPKFSSADVAGSQLASTLLKLSMSGKSEFMPSVVGMSQALQNMADAEMDDVAIKNLVGESNVTMLKSLIEGRDTFDGYSKSLAGTNTAFEQMATNNDNFEGAVTRLKSAWDALLITLGQSGVLQGMADGVMDIMGLLNDIIGVISDVIKTFDLFGDGTVENCNIAKVQIQLLSDIIKGIGTVLQIVVAVVAKAFNAIKDVATNVANGIKTKWNELKGTLTDNAFVQNLSNAWTAVYNKAAEIIGKLKKLWNDFMKWLGLAGKDTAAPAPIKSEPVKSSTSTTSTSTSTESTGTTSKGSGKGSGTPKKPKTQLEKDRDALGEVEKGVNQAIQDYNKGLISKESLEQTVKDANKYYQDHNIKADVQLDYKTNDQGFEQAAVKKVEKPKNEEGSVAALTEQYNKLNAELNNTDVSDARLDEINAEKQALQEQIEQLKIRNGLA